MTRRGSFLALLTVAFLVAPGCDPNPTAPTAPSKDSAASAPAKEAPKGVKARPID
jgi:hypothetical protein